MVCFVASNYDNQAISILQKKKKLILLKIKKIKIPKKEYKSTIFGTIHQNVDFDNINTKFCKLVAYEKVSKKSFEDLLFSLKIVKHLKSNAIVLSSNKQTVGIGVGQTNRVDALNIALRNYKSNFMN